LNWINLYPINPHSLASFRLTFFSSRAKDDPIDSQLLEELVRTHPDRLRPYQPESTTERKLDQYCRHRRSLLDLATKTELKLISTLKQYFPLAVNLFAAIGMKSDIALNFLSRWPTLNELHRAKAHTVRSFFMLIIRGANRCRKAAPRESPQPPEARREVGPRRGRFGLTYFW
jgi:hypothetical protein